MREEEGYSNRRVRSVQVSKGSNIGLICTAITEILPLPKFLDYTHTHTSAFYSRCLKKMAAEGLAKPDYEFI